MTEYILIIMISIAVIGLCFCAYGLIRNKQVFNLRNKINKEIYNLPDVRESLKLFGKYNCITYNQMVLRFFTPISKIEKELRKKIGLDGKNGKKRKNI